MRLPFDVEHQDPSTAARAGRLHTLHGEIETPVFMPVATQAAFRGVDSAVVASLGAKIILANTYHLMLQAGAELFQRVGGIHPFMNWQGPVLTDSGGFQVFSLARFLALSEEGARFRSHIDGSEIFLTPETSIGMQRAIGSDIMMILDECPPSNSARSLIEAALERTARWAKRSLAARAESPQALFGIVQGGCHLDLRRTGAAQMSELAFDGFAIGGLAVGEERAKREETIAYTAQLLPAQRPRYLMGVGTPLDILNAVACGIDMFDCILPSALAQQGVCFTSVGKVDLRRGVYRAQDESLDASCGCSTCTRFSKAYLSHLIKAQEFIVAQYLAIHNFTFYLALMQKMRAAIAAGTFAALQRDLTPLLSQTDPAHPPLAPRRTRHKVSRVRGDYEIVLAPQGYASLRQNSSGEVIHAGSNPTEEAERVYIEQSQLRQHLRSAHHNALVIWDVGLGAAVNAMSVVRTFETLEYEGGASLRALQLISFENDLDALHLTLLHPRFFPHVRHAAPSRIIENSSWTSNSTKLSWQLIAGDFSETYAQAPAADIIFFDPFSANVDRRLWTLHCFRNIACRCSGRETWLYTYSNSTAARALLLAAGFFVGAGVATGNREETTWACTVMPQEITKRQSLLGKRWRERWQRSSAHFPHGLPDDEYDLFEQQILRHRQFLEVD